MELFIFIDNKFTFFVLKFIVNLIKSFTVWVICTMTILCQWSRLWSKFDLFIWYLNFLLKKLNEAIYKLTWIFGILTLFQIRPFTFKAEIKLIEIWVCLFVNKLFGSIVGIIVHLAELDRSFDISLFFISESQPWTWINKIKLYQ